MTLDPPRRTFTERKEKGLKDVDAAARALKLRALAFGLYAGLPLGLAVGALLGQAILGGILGPALIYALVMGIASVSGRGASAIYMPSGSTTPSRKEYSRARSLEVRGHHQEAIRAYEVEILDAPGEAEPYLRIARLFRDELKDLDSAIRWFKRAQREATLSSGQAIRTHRELAEIFLHVLKEPRKAAPELARLAEAYPHTQDGDWAARELRMIKKEMADAVRFARESPQPDPATAMDFIYAD